MPFCSSGGGSSHLSSIVVELIARACVLIGDPLGAAEIEQYILWYLSIHNGHMKGRQKTMVAMGKGVKNTPYEHCTKIFYST